MHTMIGVETLMLERAMRSLDDSCWKQLTPGQRLVVGLNARLEEVAARIFKRYGGFNG